jgi:hypothetical protein
MTRTALLPTVIAGLVLAGCDSGDINIAPSTTVTDSNNTTNTGDGGSASQCASYVNSAGQTIAGTAEGDNCRYGANFSSNILPLLVDMTIPTLPNNGAHIFEASLFVGDSCDSDACLQANNISEGGDGPTLTIEAGTTVAFRSSSDFLVINRGSRIIAVGRADAPITITSESDVMGTVGPEDVQQWGGMVVNGFGVTNKCDYTGTRGVDLAPVAECHVDSEGSAGNDENQYGGNNDDDSSGQLEYFVVKHTGATVGNGDELNGITFGAVGRNTIIRNLQTYSTYDDGIEMFGGAVNFENYAAIYVRDDSIDVDEGWIGTIDNALVIQSETDGAHCIEADGIGSFSSQDPAVIEDFIARGLNSAPTINNMTCIFSPNGQSTATHSDSGTGIRLREGIAMVINDSLVVGTYSQTNDEADNDNYCLRIDNRSQGLALDGRLQLNSVIWSCGQNDRGQTLVDENGNDSGITEAQFAIDSGNQFQTVPNQPNGDAFDPTALADTDLQILGGMLGYSSLEFATSQVDAAAPTADAPTQSTYLGGIQDAGVDWTLGWTYGIHAGNRGQALWIEPQVAP